MARFFDKWGMIYIVGASPPSSFASALLVCRGPCYDIVYLHMPQAVEILPNIKSLFTGLPAVTLRCLSS